MENQATDDTTEQIPLAWSKTGEPLDLPDEAACWRVRRVQVGVKGGGPEVVYDAEGLPLVIELSTTPAAFWRIHSRWWKIHMAAALTP